MDQGAGQGHTLLLPARERCWPFIGAFGQADFFQCLERFGAPVAFKAKAYVVDDFFQGSRRAS